ncbi:MAG TPA: VOC family protein [Pyrinomonadaceae bacterium]|jgi:PhnB protein
MQLNTSLNFNGQCRAAFKFYEQCLGGKIQTMMTWGESPMADHVPAEWRDKIIHTYLIVGDGALLGSDAPPDRFEKPQGFAVTIQMNDVAEGERIFRAMSENGKVVMPFAKTFWSPGFGICVDQFGIPWMVNTGQ